MEWKVRFAASDLGDEEICAIGKAIRSEWLARGAITEEFEKKFAEFLGVAHAFGVSNGTAALHLANRALGITEGDEVICPSLTFVATANASLYCGAMPVFADITGEDDLTISPESIREKITEKTKAISVVHYGGYPCNMDAILDIAHDNGLFVIEDASHAPGAEYKGNKLGAMGDVGCFSFYPNKNMTTAEGGMVVTNSDELAEKIRLMRSHGMTMLSWDRFNGHAYSYDVTELGYNYRIDEVRSAMGIVQLEKLDKNNALRKNLVDEYRKKLSDIKGVTIPFSKIEGESSCHIFPIILDDAIDRKTFMDSMKKGGIQTSIHYPPIHLFKYYKERFNYAEGMLPRTEDIAKREITLPLYSAMGVEKVNDVVDAVFRLVAKELKIE